jgi:chromosome segregation ATPase
MPENEDNSFMSVEGELSRLVSHLETLKQEVQHYQSAAQQLNSGREDIRTAGATVSEQGKSMVDAMTTASSAIESAVHALKPLGTSEITAAMRSMEDRITKTATDIEEHFDTLGGAAKQMADAASATQSMPAAVAASVHGSLTAQSTQLMAAISNAQDQNKAQAEALAKRVAGIEQTLQQCVSDNQTRNSELLDAIEHSAPVGVFRKKRTK